jgi:hypothetical protein
LPGPCPIKQDKVAPVFDEVQWNTTVDPSGFQVLVRGSPKQFIVSDDDYAQAGIDMDMRPIGKVTRYIAHDLEERVFSTDRELLSALGIRSRMTLLHATSRWQHPRIFEKQVPSDVEYFSRLATVVERGEPHRIACRSPNSRWSDWEDIDSLIDEPF